MKNGAPSGDWRYRSPIDLYHPLPSEFHGFNSKIDYICSLSTATIEHSPVCVCVWGGVNTITKKYLVNQLETLQHGST